MLLLEKEEPLFHLPYLPGLLLTWKQGSLRCRVSRLAAPETAREYRCSGNADRQQIISSSREGGRGEEKEETKGGRNGEERKKVGVCIPFSAEGSEIHDCGLGLGSGVHGGRVELGSEGMGMAAWV